MIDKFADFVQKRAKIIIIVILLLTGLFLIPLTKIEVDSSLRLFSVESIYEPVERIADLLDLPFETIYVVGKNNESMLSLEALKEQLKIVDFVNSNFDVETTSVVEIIDKELREKKNKSIMEIRSEEELSKAAYSLFEESPEGFKKVAQRMLSKNYNNSYLEDYVFLKVFSRLIPFSGFFISKEVEMPHTELTTIWVFMKNRNASENERKQNAWMIRESVDKLDFNYVRPLYYSYLLIAYDIVKKLVTL